MSDKTCKDCGGIFPANSFNKSGSGKRRPECRDCSKLRKLARDPVERYAQSMANNLFKRLNSTEHKNACYIGIESRIGQNRAEVKAFILDNFRDDIATLLQAGETPSLDRIDSSKHYEPGNVRVISWRENTLDGSRRGGAKTSRKTYVEYEDGSTWAFDSVSAAARFFGCSRKTIYRARNGKPQKTLPAIVR